MNNRKYLVTGAAGYLGETVVRRLLERGEEVRAFVLPGDKSAAFLPSSCEIVTGDLTDKESLERFFIVPEGTETIVLHIASIVTVNPEFNPKVMEVNVGDTKNIIDLCLSHPEVKKMVYCSSTGAIPELPKGTPIKEVSHFDTTALRDCYSQSKALASQAVLDAVASRGLNACIVHPSGILGPGDYAVGEVTGTLLKIIRGDMPAGIDGSFNLADVRDLAEGIILAARKGRKGECYILANEEVKFREFAALVSEEAGSRPVKHFLPIRAAYLFADIMEHRAKKRGEKPLMTRFSVYNLDRNNTFDYTKATEELGYTTRSYRDTIKDEIAWLMENGKIERSRRVPA